MVKVGNTPIAFCWYQNGKRVCGRGRHWQEGRGYGKELKQTGTELQIAEGETEDLEIEEDILAKENIKVLGRTLSIRYTVAASVAPAISKLVRTSRFSRAPLALKGTL